MILVGHPADPSQSPWLTVATLVQVCCGVWGDHALPGHATDLPLYLAGIQEHIIKPAPDWVVSVLDALVEFGEIVETSSTKFRKQLSSIRIEVQG
jgi:hypothetical protein